MLMFAFGFVTALALSAIAFIVLALVLSRRRTQQMLKLGQALTQASARVPAPVASATSSDGSPGPVH